MLRMPGAAAQTNGKMIEMRISCTTDQKAVLLNVSEMPIFMPLAETVPPLLAAADAVSIALPAAELAAIEDEVDNILRAQLAKSADEDDSGAAALISAAHRLDNLIHHRRTMLAAKGQGTSPTAA